MPMRQLNVAMDELLDAMEQHTDPVVPYFNHRTGEVAYWIDPDISDQPTLDLDDPDLVEIPRVESQEAFRVMEDFVDRLEELAVQRQLHSALEGRGAFRRFRDTLAGYPDLREQWQRAKRDDLLQRGLAFLADLDIEPVYELRPLPSATGAPTPAKAKQPHILLHHVLLLGSPNGKTELIEGRVNRCVRSRNPAQARKQFERLAREIIELQGLGWRRSLVDGRDAIDVGPFRLLLEGDVVWLATEAPREIWDAFR